MKYIKFQCSRCQGCYRVRRPWILWVFYEFVYCKCGELVFRFEMEPWQNEDRLFTEIERVMGNRIDCPAGASGGRAA